MAIREEKKKKEKKQENAMVSRRMDSISQSQTSSDENHEIRFVFVISQLNPVKTLQIVQIITARNFEGIAFPLHSKFHAGCITRLVVVDSVSVKINACRR